MIILNGYLRKVIVFLIQLFNHKQSAAERFKILNVLSFNFQRQILYLTNGDYMSYLLEKIYRKNI